MPLIEDNSYDTAVDFLGELIKEDDYLHNLKALLTGSDASVALNRKVLKKHIDSAWVETIEELLPAVDYCIRNPRRDIKEEEKILPMELTRKVTARSVQHLSQHTNLINEIKDDGTIIPGKLLNVFKEENLQTYENKFVNTLVYRLYIFITLRYDKLVKYGRDESGTSLDFSVSMNTGSTDVKMNVSVETKDLSSDKDENSDDRRSDELFSRVEKIHKIICGYMSSPFISAMGKSYIRPPIMRTNAIMKNIYLKQCLTLWQFIESYQNVGYEIEAGETAEKPTDEYLQSLYNILAIHYMIYRYNTSDDPAKELIRKSRRTTKNIAPKIIREFDDELVGDYDFYETERRRIMTVYPLINQKNTRRLNEDEKRIKQAVDKAISEEKNRRKDEQRKERARQNNSDTGRN